MFEGGDNKPASELVQAMLTQLGLNATLDVTAYDAFADHVSTGEFNLSQMNWTALDPDLVCYDMLHSDQVDGEGQFNRSRYSDPHMDELSRKDNKHPTSKSARPSTPRSRRSPWTRP